MTVMNSLETARRAMAHFVNDEDVLDIKPFGNGHINDTYMVEIQSGEERGKLILQRINHEIFKQPVEVMENIQKVTSHLRKRLKQPAETVTEKL